MQIAPNIQGDQIIAAGHFVHRDAPKEFVIHQAVYREYGYELVDVPPATVAQRAALVEQLITSTAR
jgi:predicted ATPase